MSSIPGKISGKTPGKAQLPPPPPLPQPPNQPPNQSPPKPQPQLQPRHQVDLSLVKLRREQSNSFRDSANKYNAGIEEQVSFKADIQSHLTITAFDPNLRLIGGDDIFDPYAEQNGDEDLCLHQSLKQSLCRRDLDDDAYLKAFSVVPLNRPIYPCEIYLKRELESVSLKIVVVSLASLLLKHCYLKIFRSVFSPLSKLLRIHRILLSLEMKNQFCCIRAHDSLLDMIQEVIFRFSIVLIHYLRSLPTFKFSFQVYFTRINWTI